MEIWDQKNNRKCLGFPQYLYVKFVTLIPVIFGADVRGVTEEGSYYILRVEKSLSDGIMNYKLWSLSRPSSRARHRCLAPWQPGDFCCTETERAVVYRGVPWCTVVYTAVHWSQSLRSGGGGNTQLIKEKMVNLNMSYAVLLTGYCLLNLLTGIQSHPKPGTAVFIRTEIRHRRSYQLLSYEILSKKSIVKTMINSDKSGREG